MSSSRQVGQVAGVDSERVTVELDLDATGFVKAGPHGVAPVGLINSYVTISAGYQRIVAVVTAVRMLPQSAKHGDEAPADPVSERTLDAVMVGRIEGDEYKPGLATYPALSAPVLLASEHDVELIFRPSAGVVTISLGEAVASPGQDIALDVNKLLSRHSAVIGTTGSGKSCTVTAIIDGLLRLDLPSMNVVIFDSNGEYARAFSATTERGRRAKALVLGPGDEFIPLYLPHWFMNNAEHLDLAQAGEGAQAPLLQRAIVDARLAQDNTGGELKRIRVTARAVEDARTASRSGRKPQEVLKGLLDGMSTTLDQFVQETAGEPAVSARWQAAKDALNNVGQWQLAQGANAWDKPLDAGQGMLFTTAVESIEAVLKEAVDALGLGSASALADFDAPRYYSMDDLVRVHLPSRIDLEASNEPRIRNYAATLLMRLSSLLADKRYDFLTRVPRYEDALARYLRLLLGWYPLADLPRGQTTPWAAALPGPAARHSVTILDLSAIAADVLTTVTALLTRLLLEFAQKVEPRGSFPILLVLEEAHRYIPRDSDDSRQSTDAFERVAREGRKFGVSLMVSSQRPGELSETVLAQCGTLIAHRIVNRADQELVRDSAPVASRDVLNQLPGLATQHAIVLGQAVPAPSYVRIMSVDDPPRSTDPEYVQAWKAAPNMATAQGIDAIARVWEESQIAVAGVDEPLANVDVMQVAEPDDWEVAQGEIGDDEASF